MNTDLHGKAKAVENFATKLLKGMAQHRTSRPPPRPPRPSRLSRLSRQTSTWGKALLEKQQGGPGAEREQNSILLGYNTNVKLE